MSIPIISGLLNIIGSSIDTVADKIAPDKNIQIQTDADLQKFKLQLKTALETELMRQSLSEQGFLLKDVEGARRSEIELAKMEPPMVRYVTGMLRGIFRPLVGFAILGAFIWSRFLCLFWGYSQVHFTERDYWIIGLVATFYYGGRTLEKIFRGRDV